MIGVACEKPETSLSAWEASLAKGIILLPSAPDASVLSITPPLVISEEILLDALDRLIACFSESK